MKPVVIARVAAAAGALLAEVRRVGIAAGTARPACRRRGRERAIVLLGRGRGRRFLAEGEGRALQCGGVAVVVGGRGGIHRREDAGVDDMREALSDG